MSEEYVRLDGACVMCGQLVFVSVLKSDHTLREEGMMIQNAYPYLSPDEREFVISGICCKCFDSLFSEGE